MIARLLQKIWQETILFEGSTRSLGILRIGLVLILWARWAKDFNYFSVHPIGAHASILGFCFFVFTSLLLALSENCSNRFPGFRRFPRMRTEFGL